MLKLFVLLTFLPALFFAAITQSVYGQKVPVELAKQILKDDAEARETQREEKLSVAQVAGKLNLKTIDLNGDKMPEYILTGLTCGNANCDAWIYRKNDNKYVRIPFAASLISIKTRQTLTNGYLDLEIESHDSATENILQIYKFDGEKYVVKDCSSKIYGGFDEKTQKVIVYKIPKIKLMKCS